MKRKTITNHLGLAARLIICAGLMIYLVERLDFQTLQHVLAQTVFGWPWWFAGIILTFLGLLAGVFRWKEILAVQGFRIPLSRVFSVFFIGQFFNAFMLGACGGDVARACYASHDTPGRKTEAASTVFVDRAVGLFTTIVFCCVMIGFRIPLFLDNQGTRVPGFLMLFFLLGSLVAIFALYRRNLFEHWSFFQRLESDTRIGPFIRRAYDAVYLYREHVRVMLVSLWLSLLNLAFLTLACYSFGKSLQINQSMLDCFTLFPIISVIAAIPITPGSLGIREGLFIALYQAIGVDAHYSISMSLMVYIGSLIWSLFGGLVFVGYSAGSGHTLRAEIDALKSSQ
jgi:glycosyltransferase 2 family protein